MSRRSALFSPSHDDYYDPRVLDVQIVMRRWCVPNVQWSQLVLCATVLFLLGGLHVYRGPNGAPPASDELAVDEDTSGVVRTTQDDRAYRRLRFPKTSRRLPQVCRRRNNLTIYRCQSAFPRSPNDNAKRKRNNPRVTNDFHRKQIM